jgi:hypothetical protein
MKQRGAYSMCFFIYVRGLMSAGLDVGGVCSWSQDFLKAGGYSAVLTRLNELLEVEWRCVCVDALNFYKIS